MAASTRWSSTALPGSRYSTPPRSRSCAWPRRTPRSRRRSGAIPIFSSLPAPGSSRRATRSGPSRRGSMTERYAVIGHPVAHSQSPAIHARFAQAAGEDIEYGRIEAPLDAFERTVDEFRAGGGRGPNRTFAKAEALAARFKVTAARFDDVREPFDLVINATSAGLGTAPAVFPTAAIGKATLAYDMVYVRDTAFLRMARDKGARCADGL